MKEETKHIIFSGGGTLGPVMPLLAVLKELRGKHPEWKFLWVGTTTGPEGEIIKHQNIEFIALPPAKLRRYKSFKNITDIGIFLYDIFKSARVIAKFKPNLLVTAGGYVSVPLHFVGWLRGIKMLVHQEDVVPGLANRVMARIATLVTTTFERSLQFFKVRRKICIGNPIRVDVGNISQEKALEHFGFVGIRKTLLVIGGGTGATRINHLVNESLLFLGKEFQIIHITGHGKAYFNSGVVQSKVIIGNYKQFEFLNEDEIFYAFLAADLVITRGGMSTLSELAVLGKPAVIIPMKDSHQEQNADAFVGRGAAVLFDETNNSDEFIKIIKQLMSDGRELALMSHTMKKIMPANAREAMAVAIEELVKHF